MNKLVALVLLIYSLNSAAQTCLESITATTPTEQFIDNGDGTLTDSVRGLMWMRCSLGQSWQNNSCSGEALQLNWQQALVVAHGFEYAGQRGWRLPNVKELSSITEGQCVRPAINSELFPNTPADDYWSATPSVTDPERAWVIAFFNSSNSIKQKSLFVYARLVRTAN